MVASLSDLGSTAMTVAYFEREGYYAKNDSRQRRASFWHGKAAAAVGLPKHVSPKTFERILGGYVPGTEIRLGRARDGEHQHRPGLDLTLSAPKSVSLEALLYGNRRVLGAHDAAVKATLDWVEAELLQTRGYDPATGRRPRVAADGLVAAGFRHLTSRDQDPQLHTHCILANMTRNGAGEWRSVEATAIRRNVKLIGAYYRQELARRLIGLDYRIEATMIGGVPGFEIAGYPRELLDAFSSRRREILAWLEKHGLPFSAALTQQAALITRKRKVDKDLDTLKAEWKARAEGIAHDRGLARLGQEHGKRRTRQPARGRPYVRTADELRPEPPGLSLREVVWRAVEHLAERASVLRESETRAIALSHAPGRHELAEIDAAVTGLVADGHLVEANVRGGRSFVTGEALRAEREIAARMRDGLGAAEELVEEARVSQRMGQTNLTEGQREAVRTILLSRDRIVAVQGAAGTGKTTMLREALGLIGDRKAILLAPSAVAARVLADETGARSRTPGRRRQHALGQAVHPVEQPALFRLAQRERRRVQRRGSDLHRQPGRDHEIVDRHGAQIRDLADPFPLRSQARDRKPHPGGRAPRRHHSSDLRDWSARCRKAIAPNTETSVPASPSRSARRTRSISATRSYKARCSSSDSTRRGSSRRGPPASSCSAQATRYPETGMPSAAARSRISARSTRLQRSVRRINFAIAQGCGAGPPSGSALSATARQRSAAPGSVRRSSSASRSSHASTASPRAFHRSSSPMSAMLCSASLASSSSSRTDRRRTAAGNGSGWAARDTMYRERSMPASAASSRIRAHSLAVAITACWVRRSAGPRLMTPPRRRDGQAPSLSMKPHIGPYDLYYSIECQYCSTVRIHHMTVLHNVADTAHSPPHIRQTDRPTNQDIRLYFPKCN